ncbi:ferric cupric reductase transmembrane component 7 [Fusarium circinatum]|uniref:ferric-chelate reductase (NADPH) n=1 Tax=Fusarium circinatum TaxID=48490 RepID=A0A8H5UG46_FUSCI|nr:ferric cupric reductase transmembrane component 7 [Fusarium circinatum]
MSLLFYWTGIVALIFQAWLTFASHSAIRKLLGYEFFKATHFFAVVIFMLTFFWHCDYTLTSWHYFIGTAAVYVPCYVYPWLRTFFEYGVRTKAHVKVEDNGFVRVTIPANFTWEIGQHCFLRFTGFGLTQALSAHPFTICSLPATSADDQSFLVFYLKKQRGFTSKLYEYALQNPGAQVSVLVDGPYGGINTQRFVNNNQLVVIAGGSGAGWTLPFIEQYTATQTGQGDKDCKDSRREGSPFSSLRVILANRDVESCSWYRQIVSETLLKYSDKMVSGLQVQIHRTSGGIAESSLPSNSSLIPGNKEQGNERAIESLISFDELHGRPDLPGILKELASGMTSTDSLGVYVCGPDTMQNDARNAVASLNLDILGGADSGGVLTGPIESAAFPRIPQEIIIAIVSEILLLCGNPKDLRFRLTHRKFADCSYVNKLLFANIQLKPTRERLRNIQRGDFSRVAGYTRSITFIAYASWKLVSETWERLILFNTPDHKPNSTLSLAHGTYINDAKEAQRLLEDPDGELIETWTNVLKMVGSRLEKVRVAHNIDYKGLYLQDSDGPMDWKNLRLHVPNTRIETHKDLTPRFLRNEDGVDNATYAREYACAIVAERLFNTAITCLSASGIAISSLSIEVDMLGNVECKEIPGWQQLDLSNLKELNLSTLYPHMPCHLFTETAMTSFLYKRAKHVQRKIGDLAHDLIDKCHSTIETFGFSRDSLPGYQAVWPTRAATYDLPALQDLELGTLIDPRLLHDWLLRMKDLRSLWVYNDLADQPLVNWRYMLDAIRDHPNVSGPGPKGIQFDFPFEFYYEGVICKNSSIATPRKRPGSRYHALEAHLYGEIEFSDNQALIDGLEGNHSDMEWESEEGE